MPLAKDQRSLSDVVWCGRERESSVFSRTEHLSYRHVGRLGSLENGNMRSKKSSSAQVLNQGSSWFL